MTEEELKKYGDCEERVFEYMYDFEKALTKYFQKYGDGNGFFFEEFVKIMDELKDIREKKLDKIVKRVKYRLDKSEYLTKYDDSKKFGDNDMFDKSEQEEKSEQNNSSNSTGKIVSRKFK